MPKEHIIAEIEQMITRSRHPYAFWTIGFTQDPADQKRDALGHEGECTDYWNVWLADSVADAQDIEAHFTVAGMQCRHDNSGVASKPTRVYVL